MAAQMWAVRWEVRRILAKLAWRQAKRHPRTALSDDRCHNLCPSAYFRRVTSNRHPRPEHERGRMGSVPARRLHQAAGVRTVRGDSDPLPAHGCRARRNAAGQHTSISEPGRPSMGGESMATWLDSGREGSSPEPGYCAENGVLAGDAVRVATLHLRIAAGLTAKIATVCDRFAGWDSSPRAKSRRSAPTWGAFECRSPSA